MPRRLITVCFAFCIAAWLGFGVDVLIALVRGGPSAVTAKVLQLAGETHPFGVSSSWAAFVRLSVLFLITVTFGLLWRRFRVLRKDPGRGQYSSR